MKKIIFSSLLLIFFSSKGMAEPFNQQIEDFDKYMSGNHELNWKSTPVITESAQPRNKENTYKKKENTHTKTKKKHTNREEVSKKKKDTYTWNSFSTDKDKGEFYYKIIYKGRTISGLKNKTITFKIDLVHYDTSGDISIINNKSTQSYVTPFNKLPDDYKKLITIIGRRGQGIIYSNEKNLPPEANKKIECYRMEVLSAI